MTEDKQIFNFANEKVVNFFFGENALCRNKGAAIWLDCEYTMALYTTEGYSIVLQTEKYMISLSANGITVNTIEGFYKYCNVQLYDKKFWEDRKCFVGHKILSAQQDTGNFVVEFDNFSLKIFPYKFGKLKISNKFWIWLRTSRRYQNQRF